MAQHIVKKVKNMLDHVSIGVRDTNFSKPFYDAALKPLWVNDVARPVPSDEKSGLHFCFAAPTRASVDAFHAGALRAGGSDNGAPGLRADYGDNYYAAFVIDPDGYRLEAYCSAAG
jgi:catechol 2,3-dioxygenase-like lactoylglutathione lyase family enzyme